MRTWRNYAVLSLLPLAVIVIAGIHWFTDTRKVRETSTELNAELDRYRTEGKDWRTKCEIAKDVAASQTQLWEKCARKMRHVEQERLALAHFASAYFQRGPQQKEELIALLRSQDVELVWGLVHLLSYTVDLGPNGEWQPAKGLGGSEIAHHIANVYKTHPKLAASVASTLGIYRSAAKGEVVTLLRIALSKDWIEVFQAKIALLQIDRDGVYAQFGLGLVDEPLTDEQRTSIENYLALHGGV